VRDFILVAIWVSIGGFATGYALAAASDSVPPERHTQERSSQWEQQCPASAPPVQWQMCLRGSYTQEI
jgi:hypothetical protein